MKEKTLKIIIAALAVLLVAGGVAYAATNYGSRDDPLITKSYLDEVVKPQLESDLQTKLDAAASEMRSSAPGEFRRVELQPGQVLRCAPGSQLLPVSGSFKAAGALSDTTAGEALIAGDTLSANHLYLTTEGDSGAFAGSVATLLVSGTYSLE